jgi:hypothetical protein
VRSTPKGPSRLIPGRRPKKDEVCGCSFPASGRSDNPCLNLFFKKKKKTIGMTGPQSSCPSYQENCVKLNRFVALSVVVLFASCASSELSSQGKKVKVMKNDPPSSCEELGEVTGSSFWAKTENIKNDMREKASKMGANYVRLETVKMDKEANLMSGTAYKCPPEALK